MGWLDILLLVLAAFWLCMALYAIWKRKKRGCCGCCEHCMCDCTERKN